MSAIHEHQLPNGMTLLCLHQPHLHSVEFGLYLRAGTLYESERNQGISHLLEHLCFRALGGLDHDALQRQLSRMGAELDGATYPEAMVFRVGAMSRFFDDLTELFLRFFRCTPWTDRQIEQEKQVVLRQIELDEEDFDETVQRRFRQTYEGAFPGMGTAEVVMNLTPAEIHVWQKLIFDPCNACLCITGNFSDGMEQAAVEAFSELTSASMRSPFEQAVPMDFCMRDESSDYVCEEEGGQAKVHIAFDLDSEQVMSLTAEVLDAITGRNDDSILFQELRENEALVAEIDSSIEELGMFRRLAIRYDVRQELLEESLRKVFALLCRLRTYIRPVRLEQTRLQFTDNCLFDFDSASSMNRLLGWAWVAEDVSRADLEAQADLYLNLTAEELLDAAQAVFRPENMTISIQRDPEQTKADLAPLLQELRAMLA